MMESLNAAYADLTEEQLKAIATMIARNPIMKTWQIENLY